MSSKTTDTPTIDPRVKAVHDAMFDDPEFDNPVINEDGQGSARCPLKDHSSQQSGKRPFRFRIGDTDALVMWCHVCSASPSEFMKALDLPPEWLRATVDAPTPRPHADRNDEPTSAPGVTTDEVDRWEADFPDSPGERYLVDERGINSDVLDRMPVGWNRGALQFASRWNGEVVSVRYRSPEPGAQVRSMKGHRQTLWGLEQIVAEEATGVVLAEGEIDRLSVGSVGHVAVSTPGATFREAWAHQLAELGVEHVVVALDADESGDKAAAKAQRMLGNVGIRTTRVRPPHGDLNDWLRSDEDELYDALTGALDHGVEFIADVGEETPDEDELDPVSVRDMEREFRERHGLDADRFSSVEKKAKTDREFKLGRELNSLRDTARKTEENLRSGRFQIMTMTDLLNEVGDDVDEWVVDGLVRPEANILIAGGAKAGKSTFMYELVRGLITGEPVADIWDVPNPTDGVVALVDFENSNLDTAEMVRHLPRAVTDRFLRLPARELGDPLAEIVDTAITLIGRQGVNVTDVIIDTSTEGMPTGTTVSDEEASRDLQRAAVRLKRGVSADRLFVLHHVSHGDGSRPKGDSSWMSWPDVFMTLTRAKATTSLTAFGQSSINESVDLEIIGHRMVKRPDKYEVTNDDRIDLELVPVWLAHHLSDGYVGSGRAFQRLREGCEGSSRLPNKVYMPPKNDMYEAMRRAVDSGLLDKTPNGRGEAYTVTDAGREAISDIDGPVAEDDE